MKVEQSVSPTFGVKVEQNDLKQAEELAKQPVSEPEPDSQGSEPYQAKKVEAVDISHDSLEQVAQQLQEFVSSLDKSLQFSTHSESGREVIKVIDSNTGDILRQIPSEEILQVVSNLSKATGVLVETKV